jgi:hypothetical protein
VTHEVAHDGQGNALGHDDAERVPQAVHRLRRTRDLRTLVESVDGLAQPIVGDERAVTLGNDSKTCSCELLERIDESR